MAIFQNNLLREPAVSVPVVQGCQPGEAPVIPDKAGARIPWARTTAIAISIAIHLLMLAGGLHAPVQPRLSLTSSGQKTSASGVEVKLIARSSVPTPRKRKALEKPVPVEPQRIRPRSRVLAAKAPARNTAVVDEYIPQDVKTAEVAAEKSIQAASVPPQAAPSSVGPMMRLPGAASIKEVKNVGCDIPQPRYPFAIRRAGVEGTVWIYATIGATGDIQGAEVVESSGSRELDASARSAILSGRCDPYIEEGQGIAVAARLPVNFRLRN